MKEEVLFTQSEEQEETTYNDVPYRPHSRKHKRPQE